MLSHSHLTLNANENVNCIQEKNSKEIIQTHCKFKIIRLKQINKSGTNIFINPPFLK